jgi:hypothetical protein
LIGCLKSHRDLIDSDFALNEGGKGEIIHGKRVANEIGLAEKTTPISASKSETKAATVPVLFPTMPFTIWLQL